MPMPGERSVRFPSATEENRPQSSSSDVLFVVGVVDAPCGEREPMGDAKPRELLTEGLGDRESLAPASCASNE